MMRIGKSEKKPHEALLRNLRKKQQIKESVAADVFRMWLPLFKNFIIAFKYRVCGHYDSYHNDHRPR